MKSFRTLLERRRDYEKKGRGFNEFCKVQGAMYSYENTFNEKQANGIRIFICLHWLTSGLINKNFQNTGTVLLAILWLLMSVGLREKKGHGYSKAAAEVCKYALKFGDLSVEKTWEAFKVLKGKRLTGSFGLLWGCQNP